MIEGNNEEDDEDDEEDDDADNNYEGTETDDEEEEDDNNNDARVAEEFRRYKLKSAVELPKYQGGVVESFLETLHT
jgi:hypothetical protein